MTEKQLRSKVQRTLRKSLPDEVWASLKRDSYVDDALPNPTANQIADLVGLADERLPIWRAGWESGAGRRIPPGRDDGHEVEPRFTFRESVRIDVLSLYYAKVASTDSDLCRFRTEVLSGRTLSEEEAIRFIESPAAQLFSIQQFDRWGIDPVDHQAELLEQPTWPSTPPFFRTIRVSAPDGNKEKVRKRQLKGDGGILPYQHPGQSFVRKAPVWSGSVLDWLRLVGKNLSFAFPWGADQATMFVLCDGVPTISALTTGSTYGYGRVGRQRTITFTAAAWVSAETVLTAYRAEQQQILGGDNRLEDERSLRLFWFVEERTDAEGNHPSWQKLKEEWNSIHPDWRISDRSNFAHRYHDVKRTLLYGREVSVWDPEIRRLQRKRVAST